jgi:hypothetical protein
MLQSEWKRVINEIEKAIQKATASDKERYERSIKENSAPIVAPLNSLADQFERYKIQQQTSDERRASREKATIIGLMIAAFLTFLTAVIFYFQLNQMRIATRHTDEDARTQHSDTLSALQKAEDANRNAREFSAAQVDLMGRQLNEMVKQADALEKQGARFEKLVSANEKLANANRSILFINSRMELKQPTSGGGGLPSQKIKFYIGTIFFSLSNKGNVPAVIKTLDVKLYMGHGCGLTIS